MAKLHELQEKRRNIAAQMRQLNDEIGEKTWNEEQRTKWDSMKSELGAVESQIEREESLRSTDALFVEEQRQIETESKPVIDVEVKRSQAFNSFDNTSLHFFRYGVTTFIVRACRLRAKFRHYLTFFLA